MDLEQLDRRTADNKTIMIIESEFFIDIAAGY
jgi:hypothetical protein